MDAPSGPRPYLVSWLRFVNGSGNPRDVIGAVVQGSTVLAEAELDVLDPINAGEDHLSPSTDCDGSMFAVSFAESYNGSVDYDAYVSSFYYDDGALYLGEGHALLDFTANRTYLTAIRSEE